ncbi:MAG: flavin reductase [Acutalibacter sp.]|nr:flavin reductase [Acutalibacter sp.]
MAKINGSLGNDFCPQALFLYGNYEENGTPHFGLFCWFSYCWLGEGNGKLGTMACIGEEKTTKDLIRKTGVFSANLVTEPLLPLADYYGCTSGRDVPEKMTHLPTVEPGRVLKVPTIVESPVSFELRVLKEESLARGRLGDNGQEANSTLFLCEIANVLIDQRLTDKALPFIDRLRLAAPVVAPGEERYMNLFGQDLGGWGQPGSPYQQK